ncbi:MAG: hypothetical protein IJV22_01035 [Bacteroidales bacterium]|nr:hypothetical protein [Bacteroidales bacterium]
MNIRCLTISDFRRGAVAAVLQICSSLRRGVLCLLTLMLVTAVRGQVGIGQWRTHFSYTSALHVAVADRQVYAASHNGLFCVDMDDRTVEIFDKTNRLSDVGISTIAYEPTTKTLVVAYNNANIDLLQGNQTFNISDIKRSAAIAGNKQVNAISFAPNAALRSTAAYLATSFGVVVVDLLRHEIAETVRLADDLSLPVNDVAADDSLLWLATDNGLYHTPLGNKLLNVQTSWQECLHPYVMGQRIAMLTTGADGLIAAVNEPDTSLITVYKHLGGDRFDSLSQGAYVAMSHHRDYAAPLLLGTWSQLCLLDPSTFLPRQCVSDMDWADMQLHDADIDRQGRLWIGHDWAGLVCYDPATSSIDSYMPSGPYADQSFRLRTYGDKLFVCRGGKAPTLEDMYLKADIYTFDGNRWEHLSSEGGRDTLMDIVDVAVNPRDENEWMAASWTHGALRIQNGNITNVYNEQTTHGALPMYRQGDFATLRVGGVVYDAEGSVWLTNSLTRKGLVKRDKQGNWTAYDVGDMVTNEIEHVFIDTVRGYIWFYGRDNRIFVHDGISRKAWVNPNNGSKLETASVSCVVQDHSGDLWVGTNKGLKRIYDASRAFSGGGNGEMSPVSCSNIVISDGSITEYLMAYETITDIVVDGANRKWVGTSGGGLYLISENGTEQLVNFTTANSPLLSNKIVSLALMPSTGELFICTDAGLQSYRGTATYATGWPDPDIHAFPNPVQPDYDGPIAIKGFTRNALVHIVDAAGRVVFSTRADGGQAVWYGRTLDGQRVSSGVYFVFASTDDGETRSVAKILIIR